MYQTVPVIRGDFEDIIQNFVPIVTHDIVVGILFMLFFFFGTNVIDFI